VHAQSGIIRRILIILSIILLSAWSGTATASSIAPARSTFSASAANEIEAWIWGPNALGTRSLAPYQYCDFAAQVNSPVTYPLSYYWTGPQGTHETGQWFYTGGVPYSFYVDVFITDANGLTGFASAYISTSEVWPQDCMV